jgi:general secretion pathway protein D
MLPALTLPRALAAGVAALVISGCASTPLQRARSADRLRDFDLAVVEYTEALRRRPDDVEARMGLDKARLQAGEQHFFQGRRLFSQGRYEEAVLELQIAVELNPTNADAEKELRAVRLALRAQRAAPESGSTELESILARANMLAPPGPELPDAKLASSIRTGSQTTSRELYLTLAALGNITVTFDPGFRDTPAQVSLLNDLTVKQALDAIAGATGTFYRITAPGAIIVVNNTPAKQREYLEEFTRTFVVQNADMEETINALRIVSDMRRISPIPGTNMFTASDTAERLAAADRFVATFDKARPEVVVDVEVMEVDRSMFREYGAQIASPGSAGIDGSLDVNRNFLNLQDLRNLGRADVLTSGIPALYYRLIKTDGRTRVLASPHIRITDGRQGTASFGQEVPVPTTVIQPITQGGINIQPQTTFSYRTIGVNIGLTPRTHPNDEVTLALDIELSTLAGTGFGGVPSFGTRKVVTTIRLHDGETNVLAGLIRDDERTTRETIPGLGDIPIIGQIFGRNRREAEQTDVVIMLTPHIIRVLDITEDDLRPLRLPSNASGATVFETAPIAPPPPIIRGGGGGGGLPSDPPSLPLEAGPPAPGILPTALVIPPGAKVIKN